MSDYIFDWDELAFASKKPIKNLNATYIAVSRSLSPQRITDIIKQYLPTGHIVFAVAKEKYIAGYEGQPHFTTLSYEDIKEVVLKVNNSSSPHKVYILNLFQRDAVHVFEKKLFQRVVLVNGSWQYSFHTRPEYYSLISNDVAFDMISPFSNENEAQKYAMKITPLLDEKYLLLAAGLISESQMIMAAINASKRSFDTSFQTGLSIGRKKDKKYELLFTTWNKVVPYETFAFHYGPQREKYLAVSGDLTYYDTVHAEIMMLLYAQKHNIDLSNTTVFINLLPCRNCAKMFMESDVAEFIYQNDHSGGYAIAMLESAGKKVRRVVDVESAL